MKDAKVKSKATAVLFAGITGALIGAGITIVVIKKYFSENASPDRQLMEKAMDINKYCPAMIDEATRFDFVNVMPGNKFQFNYTMINAAQGYVDTAAAIKFIEPNVVKYLKTNTEMSVIRNNKTTVFYNYKDRNGNYLFKISIPPGRLLGK